MKLRSIDRYRALTGNGLRLARSTVMLGFAAGLMTASFGFQVRKESSRLDRLIIEDPPETIGVVASPIERIEGAEAVRTGWRAFREAHGPTWRIWLDARSGAPLLAEGPGITGFADETLVRGSSARAAAARSSADAAMLRALEGSLRGFLTRNAAALLARERDLAFAPHASGRLGPETWQVVFDHVVGGIPVTGDRYVFLVGHGRLIAFGATRWTPIVAGTKPTLTEAEALAGLRAYLGLADTNALHLSNTGALAKSRGGTLSYLPLVAGETAAAAEGIGGTGSAGTGGALSGATGTASLGPGTGAAEAGPTRMEPLRARVERFGAEASGTGSAGVRSAAGSYGEPIGAGYAVALVWTFELRVDGEPGTWIGRVDAGTGAVVAFFDRDKYARVKGGVYPLSNDHACPDGCEQAGYPMPFADLSLDGTASVANGSGSFDCPQGATAATTTLSGAYVRVHDECGAVLESAVCGTDLDLRSGPSTDCVVPAGASAGDTHASRTGYYHLNRIIEKARAWLPGNSWLTEQLTDNVNLPAVCNAFWDGGSVNFYRSGGGCRNTGEIAGVFLHEWGHGLDENDGGGFDNPSEAYADITALLETHLSCMGRGFFAADACAGYGNACLTCTGIRELDWNQRADHAASTPQGFVTDDCPSGSGPCGKEVHCEGYVAGETLWDLATRDLPASGADAATAWQIVDRLWYRSRLGSGGRAYNCALPVSDGCSATSWFTKLRVVDDDDGDLANGTPHAAAIFSAFARHGIACGAAADPANQDHTVCPALAAPALDAAPGSESASLSWTGVSDAASYRVLRNDAGCAAGSTIVATLPGTSYTDGGLANDFTEFYRIQAVGSNESCAGPLSECRAVTPQPFAGSVALDRARYGCSGVLHVTVRDANVGSPTLAASVSSTTEPSPETVSLAQIAPGSAQYTGSIVATPAPPSGDGRLSLTDADEIRVEYVDADDGQGHSGSIRMAAAQADCAPPVISGVGASEVSGRNATIVWSTDEPANGIVHYGPSLPGASSASVSDETLFHSVRLNGLNECSPYTYSVESTDDQGNTASDDNAGKGFAFLTVRNTRPSYPSAGGPISFPDNDPAGAVSTIAVADRKTVVDVDVEVDITHSWDGDLVLSLIPPAGASITLSNRRGRSGRGYSGTTFDDEAETPIGDGQAPFIGSFVPDHPLGAADGILAEGDWKLKVVDTDINDTGTIDSWTLHLSYPDADCGPHATFGVQALVADTCASGGPGSGNGVLESGEREQFSVGVENDGTVPLTGVSVRVVAMTAGVTMIVDRASYSEIPPGGIGTMLGGPFVAQLSSSIGCGSIVHFLAEVSSDQGGWTSPFSQLVGEPVSGTFTALNQTFLQGIPASWTVVNGGTGGGSAATWTTANPANRTFTPPLVSPVAMVDSDRAGGSAEQDEQLITPVMNLAASTAVTLEFDQYFQWYDAGFDEKGDVDVRSSRTGGVWVNVFRNQGGSSFDSEHQTIDISNQAAGATGVQVRFHYYDASFEWWWEIDNIKLTYSAPVGCNMTACTPALGPPPFLTERSVRP